MSMDISKHGLVPKHEVISKEEVENLLESYNISKGQLPKILVTDPAVKKIKAKIGDIVKITRRSETSGVNIVYRVVTG